MERAWVNFVTFQNVSCKMSDFRGEGMAIRGHLRNPGEFVAFRARFDTLVRIMERTWTNFVTFRNISCKMSEFRGEGMAIRGHVEIPGKN